MKKNRNQIIHGIIFFFLTYILCAFQTVVWPQVFNQVASPFFAYILFSYFGLDKNSWKSLIYCYSLTFIFSVFSYSSMGLLFMSSMTAFIFLFFVKNRVYWPGSIYFTLMTFCSLFLFHTTYLITSLITESRPAPFLLSTRLLEILFTTVLSYLSYPLIKKTDTLFKPELTAERINASHG